MPGISLKSEEGEPVMAGVPAVVLAMAEKAASLEPCAGIRCANKFTLPWSSEGKRPREARVL